MQVVTRAWSAMSTFIGVGRFQTAYSLYFLFKRRMATLQLLKSRKDGFLFLPQREPSGGVDGAVDTEEEVDKAVWERSGAVNQAMRLLTVEFFKSLHGLLGNNALYALDDERLFECTTMQQFCFTASALSLGLAGLGDEIANPLRVELPAGSCAKVVELDDDGNVKGAEASSGVGLCLE